MFLRRIAQAHGYRRIRERNDLWEYRSDLSALVSGRIEGGSVEQRIASFQFDVEFAEHLKERLLRSYAQDEDALQARKRLLWPRLCRRSVQLVEEEHRFHRSRLPEHDLEKCREHLLKVSFFAAFFFLEHLFDEALQRNARWPRSCCVEDVSVKVLRRLFGIALRAASLE